MKNRYRIRCLAMLALCAGLLASPAFAKGPGAHQHGVAKLAVAVDGPMLEISLESPLDNLLGFERAPRTDAERAAVRQMAQRFHTGSGLYTPTPAAQCTAEGAELTSDVLETSLLAAPGKAQPVAGAAESKTDGHADLDALLRFRCVNPAALNSVEVHLFKVFPKFRQIDAAIVTSRGQRGQKLTARQASIGW